MGVSKKLSFTYDRPYGVEIELNAFDQRDFKKNPLRIRDGEQPEGIYRVGDIIRESTRQDVNVCSWHHTHNNQNWVVKPDSSCGIEVCSPVASGWRDLRSICKAVAAFQSDPNVKADDRCSMHIHVNVSDLSREQLTSVMVYWIKCEHIFLEAVPFNRKRNRFCQQIGATDLFSHDTEIDYYDLHDTLGDHKYYTLNIFHLNRGNRATIEFRIIGKEGCLDPFLVKNWTRLCVHFVEMTSQRPIPRPYRKGDPWSSYLWLDADDVMKVLGFDDSYELSDGMAETRLWLLKEIRKNMQSSDGDGIWSPEARSIVAEQVNQIIQRLDIDTDKQPPVDIFEDNNL